MGPVRLELTTPCLKVLIFTPLYGKPAMDVENELLNMIHPEDIYEDEWGDTAIGRRKL